MLPFVMSRPGIEPTTPAPEAGAQTIALQENKIITFSEGPRPLGPKEIDGLLVPPGKASTLY